MEACTKKLDNINTDPNQFSTASPESILQYATKATGDFLANGNMDYFWSMAHQITVVGGSSKYSPGSDGQWQTLYVNILENLKQITVLYGENPAFANRVQIAHIWQSYVWSILVSIYGPVAVSNANNPAAGTSVVLFDTEDSVYMNVLNTLKDAASKIDLAKDKYTYDVVYGGDLLKWKKFANTLRLRIALQCQRNLKEVANKHISEVMLDEANTISSEAETAKMNYENVIGNQSPYYQRYVLNVFTSDIAPKMSDFMFVHFRSYKDPRLAVYFDPVALVAGANPAINRVVINDTLSSSADDSLRIVSYPLPYAGEPKSTAVLAGWTNLNASINAGAVNAIGNAQLIAYSDPVGLAAKGGIFAPTKPFVFMSYGEACFLKAEAKQLGLGGGQSAEAYYNAGIDANFAFWKLTATQLATYKNTNGIKFGTVGTGFSNYLGIVNTSIPLDDMAKIWIQRWINYYPDGAFDTWCLQRRTNVLDLPPHTGTNNTYNGALYATLPGRWRYPTTMLSLNPQGYTDALAKLGSLGVSPAGTDYDAQITLKFAAPVVNKDWNSVNATYDARYVQKWYGTTIEQLRQAALSVGFTPVVLKTYKP